MTIGEKIKKLRKDRNMTQEELGAAIGVQKAAINKYETGIVINLKKKTIENLSTFFRVSPAWLMNEEADWPPIESTPPETNEVRILMRGMSRLPHDKQEQLLNVARAMFAEYSDYFKEDQDET